MIKTLSDALAERGYDRLTAVQQAVTAPELQEADLLVSAQTGSGKTVGFGLAIARTLLGETEVFGPAAAPLALVVAPTRELAFQVMREMAWLYAKAGVRMGTCVGGMDMRDERRALERGAHIVVGTPGRLRDHIQRGSLDMSALRAVVLDEADEMLDLGFREDLEFMLGEAPADRRTLLFSATVPPVIAKLAQQYQRDAVRVTTLDEASQHADITYQAMRVAQRDAEGAIINVLRYHEAQTAIVFANTRAAVARLTARFSNRGFSVVSLSGELSQSERTHALQAMRDGRARVCVATDVAARGIDLPNLELVIHADLPSNAEGLLHRSGRTGRAGRKGTAVLILPPKEEKKAQRLLRFAKVTAEWVNAPSADDVQRRDEERLLGDPAWAEAPSPEEAAFADKLLSLHEPEQIAAAYLRLYRAQHSAPEDLADPGEKPDKRERKPFGPSVWFAMSVGAEDRAEARWLLPLLCRAGNIDKTAIGAIRVQAAETYVELSEPAVKGFLTQLGEGGALEDGVTIRQLPGSPDLGSAPRPRPREDGHQPARRPREPRKPERAPRETGPDAPVKPYKRDKARTGERPKAKPRGERAPAPAHDKSVGERTHGSSAPKEKRFEKPKGKGPGKPDGKPRGKPQGKSAKAPGGPRKGAADTSQRMSRPGKPGGTKTKSKSAGRSGTNPGGFGPPKRGKT